MADNKPEVAVIMGSASDWETMKHACEMLDQFEVPYMKQVISAHRTPEAHGTPYCRNVKLYLPVRPAFEHTITV